MSGVAGAYDALLGLFAPQSDPRGVAVDARGNCAVCKTAIIAKCEGLQWHGPQQCTVLHGIGRSDLGGTASIP